MRLSTPNSSAGISVKPATIDTNVRTTGRHRPTGTAHDAAAGEEPLRPVDVGVR